MEHLPDAGPASYPSLAVVVDIGCRAVMSGSDPPGDLPQHIYSVRVD